MISIRLNGEPFELPEQTSISELIEQMQLTNKRFAVEINEEIVPRSQHNDIYLKANDCVEVVAAIGGG